MISNYLRRGVAAGALGGAAMALVLIALGERSIAAAVALENASGLSGDAPFTRAQQVLGGAVGLTLAGVAAGAIFGVVFAATRHRLAGDDRRRSLTLAAAGFCAVSLVPFLKYPPNPPAVGDPSTVGRRTALYLGLIAASLIVTWAAWRLHRTLALMAPERRTTLVATAFVVAIGLAFIALPGPPDVVHLPADLVWRFRIASLAGAASFWAVLGLAHAWMAGTAGTRGSTSRPPFEELATQGKGYR